MRDNVQWLIRSSQKDTESTAFSNLPTKIGEEPTKVASPAYKLLLRSNLRNIREADLEYTVC